MWSRNPQSWHHLLDIALACGGVVAACGVPAIVANETGPALGFVVGSTAIACAGVSWASSDAAMVSNLVKNNRRDIRMLEQPTEEEKNGQEHFVREVVRDTVVTTGNVNIAIRKEPESIPARKPVPAEFVTHQQTAERVGLQKVNNAIKMICRYNWRLLNSPGTERPQGDFRYDTWVRTKKMTNRTLLIAIGILERYDGVERAGGNSNSTWIIKDRKIIERGAQETLQHPPDCPCDDCKAGGQ